MSCSSLSPSGGLYVLVIRLEAELRTERVALGPGVYLYIGSAGGPGGLRGRVCRHLRYTGKVRRWHIDQVSLGELEGLLEGVSGVKAERGLAEKLASVLPEGAKRFGNTDTGGPSHLLRMRPGVDLRSLLGSGWSYVDLSLH
ncbi:MAG: DUF123 domain-containing protein [Conexivisphaera sp.]